MKRRKFITLLGGAAVSWPVAAGAQQAGKVIRIGFIGASLNSSAMAAQYQAFLTELHELGFSEGRNIVVDYRRLDDPRGPFAVAAELMRLQVDLIVATGPEVALQAVVGASRSIPIVIMAVQYDPIARGYVSSLARPGGNITGVFYRQPELAAKQLELLTQTFPEKSRLAVLYDTNSAGRNFVLLPQWGDGNVDRLPELAVTLVNTGVDIILAEGVVTARAARAVTATIPIVMTAGADPFVGGLVQSLARPGGNVTGFTTLQAEIVGKVLEIFKDMVPGLARIAALIPRVAWNMFAPAQDPAAKALGIDVVYVDLAGPEAAGTAMRQAVWAGAQGALLRVGPFFSSAQRRAIVDLAADLRLPVMYERREYVEQGGLVTYAPDSSDLYRRAAGYVARILAGANPGDLPIEQPTKFELIINLKTARALGLEVAPTLLARADEVIE